MVSELNTGHDRGLETESGPEAERSESAAPVKRKRRFLRILVALIVGTTAIALAQSFAPGSDHQIANIQSAVAGLLTLLYVGYQLHRIAKQRGARYLVPASAFVIGMLLSALFRFDGFSGEMFPQFKLRFASSRPEMRSLTDTESASEEVASSSPAAKALADSLGFLGNQRTGVIDERLFAVPRSESEIELLWNQGIGAGWSSFSVVGDRAITLEQRDAMECLTCYRLIDGRLEWLVEHEAIHQNSLGGVGPRSTPTIEGDLVYAQGAIGTLWCVNWKTGQTKWSVDLLEMAGWDQVASEAAISWGRAGSPLLVDGLCVVPFGGPASNESTGRSLIAFDAISGETRWIAGQDQISYASPGLLTLAGIRQIVSVNEQSITGHRIEDGSVLWDFEWIGQSNGGASCAMVVPAGENRFLIGKGYGGGSALVEISGGENGSMTASAVWDSNQVLKTKFTHACVDGEVAYAISNGSLEAVSIPDGEQLWVQPRRVRLGQGQLLLVEDTLVGQAETGEVVFVAADPTEYKELFRLPAMESKTWNIPTVAGRHLLVRNDRQAFCFLLPPR